MPSSLSTETDSPRPLGCALAVMALVYPFGITVLFSVLLYKKRESINPALTPDQLKNAGEDDMRAKLEIRDHDPEIAHLRFLFFAYEPEFWWYVAVVVDFYR